MGIVVAHNVAVSFSVRRQRRREDEFPGCGRRRPTPEGEYEQAERHALLARVVRALDEPDKQIVLSCLEGLRSSEIAEVVGLSEGAVATRLSRLRSRLAE